MRDVLDANSVIVMDLGRPSRCHRVLVAKLDSAESFSLIVSASIPTAAAPALLARCILPEFERRSRSMRSMSV